MWSRPARSPSGEPRPGSAPQQGSHKLQAASALGQARLQALWNNALHAHGLDAAQVLLTAAEIADRRAYLNVRAALRALFELGAVPVLNENDATATDEISFGDNDHLAAQVAVLLGAQRLLLLTTAPGVMTDVPGSPGARVVESGREARQARLGRPSTTGRGGMESKIGAAELAAAGGVPAWIASPADLAELLAGRDARHVLRRRRPGRAGVQAVAAPRQAHGGHRSDRRGRSARASPPATPACCRRRHRRGRRVPGRRRVRDRRRRRRRAIARAASRVSTRTRSNSAQRASRSCTATASSSCSSSAKPCGSFVHTLCNPRLTTRRGYGSRVGTADRKASVHADSARRGQVLSHFGNPRLTSVFLAGSALMGRTPSSGADDEPAAVEEAAAHQRQACADQRENREPDADEAPVQDERGDGDRREDRGRRDHRTT